MLNALWLAVSLLAQVTTPTSNTAATVVLLGGEQPTPIHATPAKPKTRTVRLIFLAMQSDSLTMDGERSALRLKDASPRFELTLPPGIDADDVLLLRVKPKDGRRGVGHTSSLEHPFNRDDVVPLAIEPGDPAQPRAVRVKATAPLKPGEYALLIDMRFYDFAVN